MFQRFNGKITSKSKKIIRTKQYIPRRNVKINNFQLIHFVD